MNRRGDAVRWGFKFFLPREAERSKLTLGRRHPSGLPWRAGWAKGAAAGGEALHSLFDAPGGPPAGLALCNKGKAEVPATNAGDNWPRRVTLNRSECLSHITKARKTDVCPFSTGDL